ncbi:MAG: PilZ domain-containing protein [Bryobacterales bacterium]|nr:PilZ domain-containing protein [Bryobacterales bacterium]
MEPAINESRRRLERRTARRFPLEQEVRFRLFNRHGAEFGLGKTVNMSSRGLLIRTEHQLVPGDRLEVSVSWPVRLNNECPLKLVATGRVVRTEPGQAAVMIERYEFRTQGSHSLAAGSRA